ncbi:MAG: hypothetical protein H6565_02010 [Lewinellaceae bacterium]|nr:hypothetical protein [Lewinellaceae bacterium]
MRINAPISTVPQQNKGCPPPDQDGDGIPDKSDKCPDQAGKANQEGCPELAEIQSTDYFGLTLVKGGTFTMGCTSEQKDCNDDEKPAHQVTLSDFTSANTKSRSDNGIM